MAGEPSPRRRMTRAEYLAMERTSPDKHVLWNGEVFAMSGARLVHNRIVRNILAALDRQLADRPCEALPSDLRVYVPSREGYVYPDLSVACDPLEVEELEHLDTLLNPKIVFEVLSDTTEAFDRGEKFDGYKSVSSLEDYVLVATSRRHIDHYCRQPDGSWLLRSYEGADTVQLTSVGAALSLEDAYRRTAV